MTSCRRCGKPLDTGQRKYCSEACSNAMQRALLKIRAAGERAPHRKYIYRHVSVAKPATD